MVFSNLQSFLKCTTPSVPFQFLQKIPAQSLRDEWQRGADHTVKYFTLGDLWDCYDEWSAYGVGAPMRLSNNEAVVQYYTPYLSGIQLYTGKAGHMRNLGEETYVEAETDSMSSDSEGAKLSRTDSNSSNRTWDSEDSGSDQDIDMKMRERLGRLYFQYFEHDSPHLRLPLKHMVSKLTETYPGLNSLRNVDLSPASWMAVAWYPIYHIPAQRNPKEIYSAFLTYHTLSSSFQDDTCLETAKHGKEVITLPPFGIATYKLQRHMWVNSETDDDERLNFLGSAAASWLRQLEVDHPDFSFFASRFM